MAKALAFALGALILVGALPAAGQQLFPITDRPTIQVSGEGRVTVEPDRARLFMRVSDIQSSVSAAKTSVDDKVRRIQAMLKESGIDQRLINTSVLGIHRIMDDPGPRGQGAPENRKKPLFEVSRQVRVDLHNLAVLDQVLDRSVALGTNEIWNVELYSSREDALKLEAMQLAAADADRKARTLAESFKRKLGAMFTAEYEFGGGSGPVYYAKMEAAGGGGDFSRGTIDISARVNAVFTVE